MTPPKQEQSVAPFRVAPYFRTRIWGFHDLSPWFDFQTSGEPIGEVWLTGDQCTAETGPLSGKPLSEIVSDYGPAVLGEQFATGAFPLLVKVLFPKEKLSVQVHPDDDMAQKYGDPRGKTECWYALDAQPGAQVALGIKPGVPPEKVRSAIEDSTLEDLLEWLPVVKQDMIFVDAGTVHAIGPGVVLLETQQNSDLTYRMYDYGRPRELHLDRSMEAMNLLTGAGKIKPVNENGHVKLIDKPYFRLDRFALDAAGSIPKVADFESPFRDRVQIFFVADGAANLKVAGAEPISLNRCQIAIVPANASGWSLEPRDRAEIIRIVPQLGDES
ncbi:type I phosphomannose isomerase catalytic subunit [Acidisarcina polymorpha]|uniref:type I phosphomannose isomerase catalytic subunit n=1 Tax=Acidisarcina polymorpha TaxID=2211140 RepID=UPI000DEF3261|nr:type I phosphomannose isomerase catalytic subunit [Acidisarcina polymorpha]